MIHEGSLPRSQEPANASDPDLMNPVHTNSSYIYEPKNTNF
jgi:hypothetical protein